MNKSFQGSAHYVASDDLMNTVNIAMTLQKPLLIKGEPGTGKTMLAQAVAEALGKKLITWNIKSTTKAQDGLYVYDVVQRLYDSQFGNEGVDNIAKYIKLGNRFIANIETDNIWAPNYQQRQKRKQFYLRNGYRESGVKYEWQNEQYEIMVAGGALTMQEDDNFWEYFEPVYGD